MNKETALAEDKYSKYFQNPNVLEVKEDKNGRVYAIVMKDGTKVSPKQFSASQQMTVDQVLNPTQLIPTQQVSVEDVVSPTDFSIKNKEEKLLEKSKEKSAKATIKSAKATQKELKKKIAEIQKQGKEEIKIEKQKQKNAELAREAENRKFQNAKLLANIAKAKLQLENMNQNHEQNAVVREEALDTLKQQNQSVLADEANQINELRANLADTIAETEHQKTMSKNRKRITSAQIEEKWIETRQKDIQRKIASLEKKKSLTVEENKFLKNLSKEQQKLEVFQQNFNATEKSYEQQKAVINAQIEALKNQQTEIGLKIDKLLPDTENRTENLDEITQSKYDQLTSQWNDVQLEIDALKNQRNLINRQNRAELAKVKEVEDMTNTTKEDVQEEYADVDAVASAINVENGVLENDNLVDENMNNAIEQNNLTESAVEERELSHNTNQTSDTDANVNTASNTEPEAQNITERTQVSQEPLSDPTQENSHEISQPAQKSDGDKKEEKPAEKKEGKKEEKKPEKKKDEKGEPVNHEAFFGLILVAIFLSIAFGLPALIFGMPILVVIPAGAWLVATVHETAPFAPTKKKFEQLKEKRKARKEKRLEKRELKAQKEIDARIAKQKQQEDLVKSAEKLVESFKNQPIEEKQIKEINNSKAVKKMISEIEKLENEGEQPMQALPKEETFEKVETSTPFSFKVEGNGLEDYTFEDDAEQSPQSKEVSEEPQQLEIELPKLTEEFKVETPKIEETQIEQNISGFENYVLEDEPIQTNLFKEVDDLNPEYKSSSKTQSDGKSQKSDRIVK